MSKLAIGTIMFLSILCTAYAPFELSRYILAWERFTPQAEWIETNRLELVGLWALWLIFQVFLILTLSMVRLRDQLLDK